MKNILFLLIILPSVSFGQVLGGEEIEESNLSPWLANQAGAYEGHYSFGVSEAESEMTIAVAGEVVCAQLKTGDWAMEDGEIAGWIHSYTNYTNVRIEGNQFYSDESDGTFMVYKSNNQTFKCLKLETPPIQTGGDKDFEIGPLFDDDLTKLYGGKYADVIFEMLDEEYLKSLSLAELGIMRNEIFARYGYIFRTGGKMASYFSKQDWYKGVYRNVDQFLTEIEKANIKKIQRIEKVKKGRK